MSRATLAKIHIAKKELGLDDATYRAMLQTYGGVTSSKDLTAIGAAKVLAHLERAGFKPKAAAHGKRPRTTSDRAALIRKVEALLADAGRHWAYADGMARKMFKVDKADWLDAEQLGKVIAAMSYDAKRRRAKADAVQGGANEPAN
jgi:phage gp16-like protein